MKIRFNSLYYRTAIGLFAGLLIIEILLIAIGWSLMGGPMVQRSAEDFASLVQHAALLYQRTPEAERDGLRERLQKTQGLIVEPAVRAASGNPARLPYFHHLQKTLARLAGEAVSLRQQDDTYMIDYPIEGETLRFRFNHSRIGTQPGLALVAMAAMALIASLVCTLLLAKRLTYPIKLMANSTQARLDGHLADPLPEEGPHELRDIARNFNEATSQTRALLDNRATMLAGISHDLRAPITRARMALELARESMDETLALRIERALMQMETLTAQYLDFTVGSIKEAASPLNISAVLKEVAQTYKTTSISFDISESIVYLPSRAFGRCAQNLIDNAVKHGVGTPVEISFHKMESTWVLEVADHGAGIPASELSQVFQPFRRLDTARTQPGSGLGLSIVQEICRTQGWFVSLLPRPGGGLLARLSLPLAAQN